MIKSFQDFLNEDFDSPSATQFLMTVAVPKSKTKFDTSSVMMFYEPVSSPFLNVPKFARSFLSRDVATLMKTSDNSWRSMIFAVPSGFRCFVWTAVVQHHVMSNALDKNKGLNKYDSNLKYNHLYNESQLFMKGDPVGVPWCFPFVIWQGDIHVNLTSEALEVLQQAKDIKNIFKFSDLQWNGLIKKQECHI